MTAQIPPALLDAATRAALDRLSAAWSVHGTDAAAVVDAARFAIISHADQRRDSGEMYVSHPLEVASIVASWGFDAVSVAAACCHDVLEDCAVSYEELVRAIGTDAAAVVDGVSKVGRLHLGTKESVESASMTKFLAAVANDVRVLAVKLADRLHNLRTSEVLSEERRTRLAAEALEVFSPLAHRLGMERLRRELEDLSFKILHPEEFENLVAILETTAPSRKSIESGITEELTSLLAAANIPAEVDSRTKHLYSIYQKHRRSGIAVENMHDLVGVRAVVLDRDACYQVLGIIHANWTPVPGRFKDFIGLPRPSGYQSLHTTISVEGFEVEFQIRDEAMHLQANYGVAAHYTYKSAPSSRPDRVDQELLDALTTSTSPEQFLERLRDDLAPSSEIVVLTPNGRPVVLPTGATVIDFAYKVHTDIGHRCTGARVNGRIVPIRSTLSTGSVVEVLLGPRANPSVDWLDVVRTARAREKIRKFINDQTRDPILDGRRLLHDEFRSRNAGHHIDDDVYLARLATLNRFSSVAAMFQHLAGTNTAVDLVGLPPRPVRHRQRNKDKPSSFKEELARILGGLPYGFAKCCVPSDLNEVLAYVSQTHQITVHTATCQSCLALARDLPAGGLTRFLTLSTDHPNAWVEIAATDRVGLLRDLTEVCAVLGANILWSSTDTTGESVLMRFRVRISSRSHAELRAAFTSVPSVVSVHVG